MCIALYILLICVLFVSCKGRVCTDLTGTSPASQGQPSMIPIVHHAPVIAITCFEFQPTYVGTSCSGVPSPGSFRVSLAALPSQGRQGGPPPPRGGPGSHRMVPQTISALRLQREFQELQQTPPSTLPAGSIVWPLEAYEGSLVASAYNFPTYADWYLRFESLDLACQISIQWGIEGAYYQAGSLPNIGSIIQTSPSILFYRNHPDAGEMTATFLVPQPDNSPPEIAPIADGADCSGVTSGVGSVISSGNSLNWTYSFTDSGTFGICIKSSSSDSFELASIVQVQGGNPAWFTNGQIFLGKPLQLVFTGAGLTSSDAAKVIDSQDSCSDGVPSTKVQQASGVHASADGTAAVWTIVINQYSAFNICYRRADHDWSSVPDLNSLSYATQKALADSTFLSGLADNTTTGTGATDTPANGNSGTPTSPTSPETPTPPVAIQDPPAAVHMSDKLCPLAPPRSDAPGVLTMVEMSIAHAALPSKFFDFMSSLTCVPQANINVNQLQRMQDGIIVTMDFSPSVDGNYSQQERINYLVYISATNISVLAPIYVTKLKEVERPSLIAVDPQNRVVEDTTKKGAIIGGTVAGGVAVIALCIFIGVLVYRRYNLPVALATAVPETHPVQGVVVLPSKSVEMGSV